MRWHKFISTILHPVVMPTIGVLLFFIISSYSINEQQLLAILSLVFTATYIVPILLLVFLKLFGLIDSYQVSTIRERKIPVIFMIVLFFLLGKTLNNVPIIRDFSILFYGTSISLTIVYLLFFTKTKASLHLLSMGNAIGFFMFLTNTLSFSTLYIIIPLVLLSGLLASSRLHLKAHNNKEVYLGFFLGILGQLIALYL
ncbi:hypothetical protein WH52_02750 [Tenacibaculum holothuriorum]|uniref:PA-phosphatase n=1 Tax=Tenacibaculum holothuriorum TaxID=1635173 RepID=A0A1Y2PDP8_9FLAO|nr:hypothetical protein [Tenacibaculum holothuriorum]OSY88616.1 hypothetical protein WH52_02750 [Tenacibaculum holothuriorum]